MHMLELIEKKRDGNKLTRAELKFIIDSYVKNNIPDYQMSALLMAVYLQNMNATEVADLTHAMLHSGNIISHNSKNILVDKHSTGGVGDKISIALVPIVAACGLNIPMIAGRGLGHTGGTLDKLESIPGFNINLSTQDFKKQITKIGCAIMGQTCDIAPADKKIYKLRDVTGTVESIPLIASSIMSKKCAEGISGLVLDVKVGSGAFMKNIIKAKELALCMCQIGQNLGVKTSAFITNMDQPLGIKIGTSLEIQESIEILQNSGPKDVRELTILLACEMLVLAQKTANHDEARELINNKIISGAAWEIFLSLCQAQGANIKFLQDPKLFVSAAEKIIIKAPKSGCVKQINSKQIGTAVALLGGGRFKLEDKIDYRVGLEMHVKIGDQVEQNQPLCTLHVTKQGIPQAQALVAQAIVIDENPVAPQELVFEKIGA